MLAVLAARSVLSRKSVEELPSAPPSTVGTGVVGLAEPLELPLDVLNSDLVQLRYPASGDVALAFGSEGTIVRSSDDGQSWQRVESGTREYLFDGAEHPSGAVVLAGSRGTLLRSLDQARSFVPVRVDSDRSFRALATADDGTFVAVGDEGVAYASRDAGQSFVKESSGSSEYLSRLVKLPGQGMLVAGDHATLLLREPSGRYRPLTLPAAMAVTALAVLPDGTILVGTQDGFVLASSDSGASFRESHKMREDMFVIGFEWSPDMSALVARLRTRDVLFSSDRGKSFERLPFEPDQGVSKLTWYPNAGFVGLGSVAAVVRSDVSGKAFKLTPARELASPYAVEQNPKTHTLLAVGASGLIARSADAGRSIHVIRPGLGGVLRSFAHQASPECLLAVGLEGTLLRSTDGGKSWARSPAELNRKVDMTSVVIEPKTSAMIASGTAGTLLRSLDCAEHVTPIEATKNDVHHLVAVPDAGVFALVAKSPILRSDDGGLSFAPVQMGGDATLLRMISTGSTLIAVGEGGRIYRSKDAGRSFQAAPSGSERTLRAVAFDAKSQTVFVAGDGGTLLRSTDGGETFAPLAPPTDENLFVIGLHPDSGQLLVGGNRGVVLRSLDAGQSFTQLETRSTQTIRVIFFEPNSREFSVAGVGGTLLRSVNNGNALARVRGSFEGRIDAALFHAPSRSLLLGGDRLIRVAAP